MSVDDQIEIIQNDIINYFTYDKLLIYGIIIIIKKIIIIIASFL